MASGPDLFVVCKKCGSEVSPYITECPYCGTRLRKRAPKLERGGVPKEPKAARRRRPTLGRLRPGEIPGIRGDRRPYATILLVLTSIVVSIAVRIHPAWLLDLQLLAAGQESNHAGIAATWHGSGLAARVAWQRPLAVLELAGHVVAYPDAGGEATAGGGWEWSVEARAGIRASGSTTYAEVGFRGRRVPPKPDQQDNVRAVRRPRRGNNPGEPVLEDRRRRLLPFVV